LILQRRLNESSEQRRANQMRCSKTNKNKNGELDTVGTNEKNKGETIPVDRLDQETNILVTDVNHLITHIRDRHSLGPPRSPQSRPHYFILSHFLSLFLFLLLARVLNFPFQLPSHFLRYHHFDEFNILSIQFVNDLLHFDLFYTHID